MGIGADRKKSLVAPPFQEKKPLDDELLDNYISRFDLSLLIIKIKTIELLYIISNHIREISRKEKMQKNAIPLSKCLYRTKD